MKTEGDDLRILALDIGTKRVGVALSDEMGMIATGLSVINRLPKDAFLDEVKNLANTHQAELILLGLPRRMDGELGPEAHRVLDLASKIKAHCGIKVDTWNEWLSTVEAERVLIEADMSRKKRKKVIDKVAAVVILQNYLDFLKTKKNEDNS